MKSVRSWGRFAAAICALQVIAGCTPPAGETSSVSRGAKTEDRSRAADRRTFEVIDRAARWKTSVSAMSEPKVVMRAGYVHVQVDVGAERPVDCFIYDAPIVTGQAVSRLLDAAQIGITYDGVVLDSVEVASSNPLLLVRAEFTDEETGAPGRLFVGLVPRVTLPVVCSQESDSSDSLMVTLRHLISDMSPSSYFSVDSLAEKEKLLVFELWTLFDGERPVGFRQWRAARNPDGEVSTLEIASVLESQAKGLVTTDVRISERADDAALLISDWLELVDGEVHARAALERIGSPEVEEAPQGRWSYRVAGVGPTGPVTLTIDSEEPLRTAYDEYQFLGDAEDTPNVAEFSRFLPHMSLVQPTTIQKLPPGDQGFDSRLQVGQRVFGFQMDGGEATRRTEVGTSRRAELGLRLLGASGD